VLAEYDHGLVRSSAFYQYASEVAAVVLGAWVMMFLALAVKGMDNG
jgi:hypothetical protein